MTKPLILLVVAACSTAPVSRAALAIQFIENTSNNTLKVIFSGSDVAPMDITTPGILSSSLYVYKDPIITSLTEAWVASEPNYYGEFFGPGVTGQVPWGDNGGNYFGGFGSGAGGYLAGGLENYLYATAPTLQGEVFYWDGTGTMNKSLADLSMTSGTSGSFGIPHASGSITINWSAETVPEPSAAILLGLTALGLGFRRSR